MTGHPFNRWAGERAFVVATGASLTQDDVDAVRGQGRVIAVNKAYLVAPWADVLFSIDRQFWDGVAPEFAGEKWTVDSSRTRAGGLHRMEDDKIGKGLGTKRLHWIAGSGGTAINLACLFGCRPIVLLGFDMQLTDGRAHFHPDYPRSNPDAHRFRRWRMEMGKMLPGLERAGVEVINCTRDTSLVCFPYKPLEDVL